MADAVLALNAGSSSIKFSLYRLVAENAGLCLVASGGLDGLDLPEARLEIVGTPTKAAPGATGQTVLDRTLPAKDAAGAFYQTLFEWIAHHRDGLRLRAVGHRVVHGGAKYVHHARITPEVLRDLHGLIPLAPLHEPHNIAAIEEVARRLPGLPQVACFDTSFHAGNSPLETTYAIPAALRAEGLRKYGFHGLSYQYIAGVLPDFLGSVARGRVIVAHLGSGASLCAMRNALSVATTMGFSVLDGLVMGTRPGLIDPGVLLYLMREKGLGHDELSALLYSRCGLLGLSGISADMRVLLAADAPAAKAAIAAFVYRVNREIGALSAILGGLDALVFTAGIGENAASVRADICQRAAWLGISLDPLRNDRATPGVATRISAAHSKVEVHVIPTDEDLVIARECVAMLTLEAEQKQRLKP